MAKPKYRTPEHRAARKSIDQAQARGEILLCVEPICVMTSREILPDQPADVCHDTSGTVIIGPGHSRCNRLEGAVRGERTRKGSKALRWAL